MIISIITCERPVNYLDQTLKNLKSFGIDPIIFKDTHAHERPNNVLIALDAFRYAYNKNEDLLFLEDDILIQDPSLLTHSVPKDCIFTSFYNSWLAPGKWQGIHFGECQALKIPVSGLKFILDNLETRLPYINAIWGFAMVLKIVCKSDYFELTSPMLKHIGDVSTFR